jgi:hypothetical protein
VQEKFDATKYDDGAVEFLPWVASFETYEDENGGMIRYLANVTYHGPDGKQKGESIAPFFDGAVDEKETSQDDKPCYPAIAVAAIGCGIEEEKDVEQIKSFLSALGAGLEEVLLEYIGPNPEFVSVKEENLAYRQLDYDAKKEATQLQTIGPGKMAKFVMDLVERARKPKAEDTAQETGPAFHETDGDKEKQPEGPVEEEEEEHFIDPNKKRYACRICRELLFGQEDLEDPPHVPSRHQFGWRKKHGGGGSDCQSLFLASGLLWMGDMTPVEGNIDCPHCHAKLGHWKWAGAQCSCGTWVTPAIQVTCSRVDLMLPPSSTVDAIQNLAQEEDR